MNVKLMLLGAAGVRDEGRSGPGAPGHH